MALFRFSALIGLSLLAGGCVTRAYHENAALVAMRPQAPPPALSAYIAPQTDFPTIGGDILKGTSPADLESARGVGPLAPDLESESPR
ncbi:MAG TPA: hypothetical protein VG166_00590 [Caulobacteraceae bacterium]|jgi:hypothetical protein|nr:hypothetical protein [Caulobacteraceae bacterium]